MIHPHLPFEPLDPGRIDAQSADELQYWSTELQCTPARLVHVIERVGNHVSAVREYLHQHSRKGRGGERSSAGRRH